MARTRARCITEKRNLSEFATDPGIALAAKLSHEDQLPSHKVTIIAEQEGALFAAGNFALAAKTSGKRTKKRPASKKRTTTKKRATGKKRTAAAARRLGTRKTSKKRARAKKARRR